MKNELSQWQLLKEVLEKERIDIGGLSVKNYCKNETVIPYLINQLGEDILLRVLSQLTDEHEISIYQDDRAHSHNIIYANSDFVICHDGSAYLTNPYDNSLIQRACLAAEEFGRLKIVKIGIISARSTLLGRVIHGGSDNKLNDIGAVKLLNNVLDTALKKNASDIQIFPRNGTHVYFKYKVNKQFVESGISDIGFDDYQLFANALLDKAGLDAGMFVGFKEAKFNHQNNWCKCNVRLQMNPTVYEFVNGKTCPSFVLRLHKRGKGTFKSLPSLGLMDHQHKVLSKVSKYNQGLVLVSGPVDSGKTTTLYSILAQAKLHRNIVVKTIEDPVEISLASIQQMNIDDNSGVTYANALKAMLRSGVDLVLIGEIRDEVTARKAIELEKTGILVLSTLHTKNSLSIISRLKHLGVSAEDIADALTILMSTRLVPELCQYCATDIRVGDYARMKKYVDVQSHLMIKLANKAGCSKCQGGYSGQLLVAEVFYIDNTTRRMIVEGQTLSAIEGHIVEKHHNKTIWDHGLRLLTEGRTDIESLENALPIYAKFGDNFSEMEAALL